MKEFKISDYSIFTTSANSVTSSINKLNSLIAEVSSLVQQLNSPDVFQGPICNSCVSGWKTIEATLKSSTMTLTKATLFLNNSFSLYQNSDNNNASNIGGA